MEAWVHSSVLWLLSVLALPKVGLSAIFIISLVSATLLPLGSEPAVFAFVKVAPDMFWPAILVATVGNTLGGIVSYVMGLGAEKAYEGWRHRQESGASRRHGTHLDAGPGPLASARRARRREVAPSRVGGRWHVHIHRWADRLGPVALLFSWLPVVGDPLCAVAGWLRLSFWPCVFWMAIGKAARYITFTVAFLHLVPFL
ncbi:MAG TPA: YqaA family protein [Burkholderiaceae bacterium]|nr:YqaA family protein [Burkholderiaceae bacterium]